MKIAILYHFVPHYREGFVRALDSRSNLKADWFASTEGVDGIKTLSPSAFFSFKAISNFTLGPILFQPAALLLAIHGKYDAYVFLSSPYFICTWIAAFILRIRGKRVIFWGHGPQKGKRALSFLEKYFYRLPQANYLYGFFGRKNLIEMGIPQQSIYVGLNSLKLPTEDSNEDLNPTSVENKGLTIAALSRMTAACKYDQLLKAVALARDKYSLNCTLIFIGDGECKKDLQNMAIELGLEASFVGAIYDEQQIAQLLNKVDLLSQPGKVGLSAMHALSYGIPVLTHSDYKTQMPEVEAVVHGVTGLLHKKDDIEDIAKSLLKYHEVFPSIFDLKFNCKKMVRQLYNPQRQVDVLIDCIFGGVPEKAESVKELFYREEKCAV
jgi:glycosyltransferase involved in cell wall biosynthesis